MRRLGLTFAVATLVPVLLLGWLVSSATRDSIEERSTELYGASTATLVRLAASSLFTAEAIESGRPMPAAERAVIDTFLTTLRIDAATVRVLVADRRGRVVYANYATSRARIPLTPDVRQALSGAVASDILDADDALNGEGWDGRPVESAIPLELPGHDRPLGVLVASGLDTKFVEQVREDVSGLRRLLAAGLAGLWLLLLPIMLSVSRRLRREVQRNEHLARHDSLTGLPNRQLLDVRVTEAIAAAERTGGLVGLLLLDLDRFKEVNDTLGHRAGDRLLEHVAERLRDGTRATDTVARLGGDEFAVVLVEPHGEDEMRAVLGRILQALQEPLVIDGFDLAVDASIGVAVYPNDASSADELLQRADVAMYSAKASDAPFAFYAASEDSNSPSRLALAADLRRALTERLDQVVVHYQPVVGRDGSVAAMEALVRWEHPGRGLLGPDAFIPIAEESGLIHVLTAHVLEGAIGQARAWADAGLGAAVAVNLSARDLRDVLLVERVRSLLERHGLAPDRLELEITETAVLGAPDTALRLITELRELGVSVALDDFGTGFSSLTNLKRLGPDRIKVDRGFVAAMAESPTDLAIVRSVIELAHRLGIGVTAEGVETEAQREHLDVNGCDLLQGYLISPPLPAGEATAWLAARASLV